MTPTGRRRATRHRATSWSWSRPGRSRPSRSPRRPRNGLASARHREVGQRLVATDVERADGASGDRRAPRRWRRTPAPARRCRARCSRPRKRNSVRTRPEPSAPAAKAVRASATEPTLAATMTGVPSRTTAGSLAWARWRRATLRQVDGPAPVLLDLCGSGSTRTSPARPVDDDLRPLGDGEDLAARGDDQRDAPRPGQDRGVRRGAAGREHDARSPVRCPGRRSRPASGRGPRARPRRRSARPRLRRGRGVPAPRRRVRRRLARAGRGRAARPTGARSRPGTAGPRRERTRAGGDPVLDVRQHLGVGQQRQVGVEDARLGATRPPAP